jgi:two-component system CitB family response regulator
LIQVLIVEDDIRNANINRRFVEKIEGYEVAGIATDGLQAKDMLEILQPELVLLDLYVPDVVGFDLLRHIKVNHIRTDIIMITATKELNIVRDAIHEGIFDYIVKPIIFERLRETMEKYKNFREQIRLLEKSGSNIMIDQYKIDELLRGNNVDRNHPVLPKGIDQLTLVKVINYINDIDVAFTAEQVSTGLGVSRSTSRRYLEFMVSMDKVTADLTYGTVGRPERVYMTRRQ